MSLPQSTEMGLVKTGEWRVLLILLTGFLVGLFIVEAILYGLALQAALQADFTYATIHIANSYLPLTLATITMGIWQCTFVVFGYTISSKKVTPGLVLQIGILPGIFLAYSWFLRGSLLMNFDTIQSPPVFLIEGIIFLPPNIHVNILNAALIGITPIVIWYRWLRLVNQKPD